MASRAWLAGQERGLPVDHVLAVVRRAVRAIERRDRRLADLGPVQIGLRHAEHVVDQDHLVVLRHQGDRVPLAAGRRQFVQGLRSARRARVGQVRLLERRAADGRVQERIQQRVVTAVVDRRGPGQRRLVGRVVLRGLPVGGEQVLRGHVVTLVLVDHGEAARRGAGLPGLGRETRGRDLQPAFPRGAERGPEEAGPVAERHLPEDRARRPSTQRPWASASGVAPTWVRLVPLNPKSMVTMASRGSWGSTGAAAGVLPCVITSGSYTQPPGPRVQDRGLHERAEVGEVGHGAAGGARRRPGRPGQLVGRGQALSAERVRRHHDVTRHVGRGRGWGGCR